MQRTDCQHLSEPGDLSCGCLPRAFSRLRYFYGKQMSVPDFVDEQMYHVGKRRLHNQRAHGSGVLCGLGASPDQDDESKTIVRVQRGVALDGCGREIVVGFDRCVDLGYWYEQRRKQDPKWPEEEIVKRGVLWVCLSVRYKEAACQPEPAPRDPCKCDFEGCDYGRIDESFQVEIMMLEEDMFGASTHPWPTSETIEEILISSVDKQELLARMSEAIGQGCPHAPDDPGVVVGCFALKLSANGDNVTSIEDHQPGVALFSTATLQELLLQFIDIYKRDHGNLDPRITGIELSKTADRTYVFTLSLSSPVLSQTVIDGNHFRLLRLTANGWDPPGSQAISVGYDQDATAITLEVSNRQGFLVADATYRLSLAPHLDPIVDSKVRRLQPMNYEHAFSLKTGDGGALTMAPVIEVPDARGGN